MQPLLPHLIKQVQFTRGEGYGQSEYIQPQQMLKFHCLTQQPKQCLLTFVFQKHLRMLNQTVSLEFLKKQGGKTSSKHYPRDYIIELKDVPIFELVKAYYAYQKFIISNSPEVSSDEEEEQERTVKTVSTASVKVQKTLEKKRKSDFLPEIYKKSRNLSTDSNLSQI